MRLCLALSEKQNRNNINVDAYKKYYVSHKASIRHDKSIIYLWLLNIPALKCQVSDMN